MVMIRYRLNSEENVQMVTALILQLIQSIIKLPDDDSDLSAATADIDVEKVRLWLTASALHSYIINKKSLLCWL